MTKEVALPLVFFGEGAEFVEAIAEDGAFGGFQAESDSEIRS